MLIQQGGNGFPFLHRFVYTYMCTGATCNVSVQVEELPDPTLKFVCQKVTFLYVVGPRKRALTEANFIFR